MSRHSDWCEKHGEHSSHRTIPSGGYKSDLVEAPKGQGESLAKFKQHLRDIRKEIYGNED